MYRSESESSHGPRELWLTEWGFPTFIKLNPLGLFDGVSEIVQAKYILRRFVEALALEVEVSIQYDFRNDGLNAFNPEHNFGLVDFALRTKPAFNAVQRVNRFLRDCNPDSLLKVSISPLTSALTEPIRCYGFRASNGRVLFAIWRAIAATDEQLTLHSIITLASAREIRSLHSVNLLNGETKAVSFSSLNGNAIVTDLEIYDYPILLIGRK
jgi:hypothetical protein